VFEVFRLLRINEPSSDIILGIISAALKSDTISRPLGCLCCFELRQVIDVIIVYGETPALNLKKEAKAESRPSNEFAYVYGRSNSVTSFVNC